MTIQDIRDAATSKAWSSDCGVHSTASPNCKMSEEEKTSTYDPCCHNRRPYTCADACNSKHSRMAYMSP